MIKKRIIAALILKNGIVVQSIGFKQYLPVGRADIFVEFLNTWGVDEILILDIDASKQGLPLKFSLFQEISKKSLSPLSIGGGIKSIHDIQELIHHGADKVTIHSHAICYPHFIHEAASIFGSQCITVCLNIKKDASGHYRLCHHNKIIKTDPFIFAKQMQDYGAGEILVNNIDADGKKQGYDLYLMEKFSEAVHIPLIALGGVGRAEHFLELAQYCDISGLAAGNFFHFSEHSLTLSKSYLYSHAPASFRLDSHFDYQEFSFDKEQRLIKKSDQELSNLLFEFHEKEHI